MYRCAEHDGKYGECLWKKPCEFVAYDDYAQCNMRHLVSKGKRLYPEDMPVRLQSV